MDALILADGEAPDRAALDRAWPGWDARSGWSSPPTAARASATRLGVAIDAWVGDGDSLDADGMADARGRAGCRCDRAEPAQGRIGHRARRPGGDRPGSGRRRRSSAAWAATGSTTPSPTSACWRCRSCVGRAGVDPRCANRGSPLVRAPAADGLPVRHDRSPVGSAISSRCCRSALASSGSRPQGLDVPARRTSHCPPVRPAGCRTCGRAVDAAVTVARGLLLVVESPATLSRMSMPAVGDPAPEVALPDETGTDPSPGRSARPLDHPLLLPDGRHARLHRRGLRVPRQQRDDHASAARTSGGSARRVPASKRAFREKFGLPFTPAGRRGPPRRRHVRHVGREEELRQDLLGHGPDDLPDRPGRARRPGLAKGQAGGPRRRGPGRARRARSAAVG